MMYNVGDLVIMQRSSITLKNWKEDEQSYITGIVTSIKAQTNLVTGEPIFPYFYEILAIDGRRFVHMREDRLELIAKC